MNDVIRPVILPVFWLTSGISPTQYTMTTAPATVRLLVNDVLVDDFTWGWPQQTLTIKLDVLPATWPPPAPTVAPPPGATWRATPELNANYLQAARIRSDTREEVNRSGGSGFPATGQVVATFSTGASRSGPTGYFRMKFPNAYVPADGTWTHTDPLYWLNVYPDDLDMPGVNVETPLQFSGRPSVGISGQLLTAIDGGSP